MLGNSSAGSHNTSGRVELTITSLGLFSLGLVSSKMRYQDHLCGDRAAIRVLNRRKTSVYTHARTHTHTYTRL